MTGGRIRALARIMTAAGTTGAMALTAHTMWNLRHLRTPSPTDDHAAPTAGRESVSVLLPVRDEASRLEPGLRSLLAEIHRYGSRAELVVLDDESRDGTAELVRALLGADRQCRLISGRPRPAGWLGKPWACHQLAGSAAASSTVLVFVDADVELRPGALGAAVAGMRQEGVDLLSPWPQQVALTPAERLVQPLQQWSWLTTMPLAVARRGWFSSMTAANGQLLVLDRAAYTRAGGHATVRGQVLDDIALARAMVGAGGRAAPAAGHLLASCRMYEGWAPLRDGYTRSLWAAFGSRRSAAAVLGTLGLVYVWPALAALAGSPVGALGYAAGVAGRAMTARRTGGRPWPDSLAHPASVSLLGVLTVRSWRGLGRGTLRWKDRPVVP